MTPVSNLLVLFSTHTTHNHPMKPIKTTLLLLFLTLSGLCKAQNKLSADVFTGLLFHQTAYTANDYTGHRPNLSLGAGLGYNLLPEVRLRGQLVYGMMNGNNDSRYFETNFIEPSLGLDINLLQLLSGYSGVKLNLYGGTGMSFYHARLYNSATGQKITESPVRRNKSMSPNALMAYGGSVEVPLSHKLSINLRYVQRYLFETNYLDVTATSESDHYGSLTAGLSFYLSSDRKPGTTEVDDDRFKDLNIRAEQGDELKEQMAKADLKLEEKDRIIAMQRQQIESMEERFDSLAAQQMQVTAVSADQSSGSEVSTLNLDEIEEPAYRIVIASLPSREKAYKWIKAQGFSANDQLVVFVPEVNSYRIVHSSHPSFAAARKELGSLKQRYPDSWIIKF